MNNRRKALLVFEMVLLTSAGVMLLWQLFDDRTHHVLAGLKLSHCPHVKVEAKTEDSMTLSFPKWGRMTLQNPNDTVAHVEVEGSSDSPIETVAAKLEKDRKFSVNADKGIITVRIRKE